MKHIGTWLKRKDPGFSLLFAIILTYFQVILFIQVDYSGHFSMMPFSAN